MDFTRSSGAERPERTDKSSKSTQENKKMCSKITREIKRKSKQCKEQWLEERCMEVDNSARNQNPQKHIQMVNEICGSFSPRLSTVKDKNGRLLDIKADIKNRWKQRDL